MADIELRFFRDMLVLSSPTTAYFKRHGFDPQKDTEYLALFEPEMLTGSFRSNVLVGAQCLVTDTASVTPARLAHTRMEEDSAALVAANFEAMEGLRPQHVLCELGPCGLPLDASSKASLNENRSQYAAAARAFLPQEFDGYLLNGFSSITDLKCALMGVSQVDGRCIFASVEVDADGVLASGRGSLEEAVEVMREFGAAVVGFSTAADPELACALVQRVRQCCDLPVLVQLEVGEVNPKQWEATPENPYYSPDLMMDAGLRLAAAGVQFLRAVGNATPAYAGALVAATEGKDVVQ